MPFGWNFIDHQSSSSSPLPGRWSCIHLTFCLTRNKLQYEKRIKWCVLTSSVLTRSPFCWPGLRPRKSCMKQLKHCRMGERSGPSSLRLCRRNLQMTWALSEKYGERSLREDGFRVLTVPDVEDACYSGNCAFFSSLHAMWEHMLRISRVQ